MGQGTSESPWDLQSALGGEQKIAPGDTVWIHAGTYKKPFEVVGLGFIVRLSGRLEAPVKVRARPGERVTIDGGLNVQPPSSYLWIQDLEILVSEPRPEKPVPPDPTYRNVNRPFGGLNIYTGTGCKYIDLVIHDNCQGVRFGGGARESELYGCIIYDNGWVGTDRGHGHAIYTQNHRGIKTIADCIMTGGYAYSLHGYGVGAFVNNYLVEGNICYKAGTFLLGGHQPSQGIHVLRNTLYAVSMQLGYAATENEDCEVRDNVIFRGSLNIKQFRQVVNEGNVVLPRAADRPKGSRVILRPNRYDPQRAHLAIFNWDQSPAVAVDASGFLKRGDRYRLMSPRDFFGKPVLTGTFDERPIPVPVSGEFAAFVLLK